MLNNPASSRILPFHGQLLFREAGCRAAPPRVNIAMDDEEDQPFANRQPGIGLLQGFPAFFEQAVDLQDGLCARDALHECPLLAERVAHRLVE